MKGLIGDLQSLLQAVRSKMLTNVIIWLRGSQTLSWSLDVWFISNKYKYFLQNCAHLYGGDNRIVSRTFVMSCLVLGFFNLLQEYVYNEIPKVYLFLKAFKLLQRDYEHSVALVSTYSIHSNNIR